MMNLTETNGNSQRTNNSLPTVNPTPKQEEWKLMNTIAKRMLSTGFLPSHIKNENQALMIMLTGREMGIPPMLSLRSLFVIDQRVGMSAQLMVSQVKKTGLGKFEIKSDDDLAEVKATRLDTGDSFTSKWSKADAKRAGLLYKNNWQKYPKQMLINRALAETCRFLFPDLLANIYTEEEINEAPKQEEKIKKDISSESGPTHWSDDEDKVEEVKKEIDKAKERAQKIDQSYITTIKMKQKTLDLDDESYRRWLKKNWGVSSCTEMTTQQAKEAVRQMNDLIDEHNKKNAMATEPEVAEVKDETPPQEQWEENNEKAQKYQSKTIEEILEEVREMRKLLGWSDNEVKEWLKKFKGKTASSFKKEDWIEVAVAIELLLDEKEETDGEKEIPF